MSLLVENALQWLVQRPPEVTLDATFTVAAEGSLTLRVDAAADPDGGLASYAWDLGDDGTTDCTTATCLFDAAGYDDIAGCVGGGKFNVCCAVPWPNTRPFCGHP